MFFRNKCSVQNRKKHYYAAVIAAVVIMGSSGYLYRVCAVELDALSRIKVFPPIPLNQFPIQQGAWRGQDIPISESVLKVAANDDYVNRLYTHRDLPYQVNLYIAYTSEPRRMLGHRPRVCYRGSGWDHDGTEEIQIVTTTGKALPVLVHRFHKSGLNSQDIVVLNYYVVNGELTVDHKKFDTLRWRRPKMSGGRLDYVAQIQVSSASLEGAKLLIRDFSDDILRHLPPSE